jgi:hypothetical protein
MIYFFNDFYRVGYCNFINWILRPSTKLETRNMIYFLSTPNSNTRFIFLAFLHRNTTVYEYIGIYYLVNYFIICIIIP